MRLNNSPETKNSRAKYLGREFRNVYKFSTQPRVEVILVPSIYSKLQPANKSQVILNLVPGSQPGGDRKRNDEATGRWSIEMDAYGDLFTFINGKV